jgi:hypothetical protein
MKRNLGQSDFGSPRARAGERSLVAVAAALLLTGILGTNAFAAPHGGGGAPLFNSVPSNQGPTLNPSSPYTMPTTPETPVSPASPGSVFGNG